MPWIPHTDDDTTAMLESIGVDHTETLFDEIPANLRYEGFENIPEGINESTLFQEAYRLAAANANNLCFLGAGAYKHHIPAAVWRITSRGEFLTAYTPYQAEASQGTLQLLYEFQTMIAELTGMDVSNASLYDGATALAEAVLMAVRLNKHSKSSRILIAGTVHPLYRETLETIVRNQQIEIVTLDIDYQQGITPVSTLTQFTGEDITALVIPQPNFFGCLEAVDDLTNWATQNKAISIACVNPISLGLLKPPACWGTEGVDIVCGEGQPLGCPLASGGPYFGFLSTRMAHVRQMPGRLAGKTLDKAGKPGYTLTLQAREQHIRRAKATSNICTNQGLLVTAATIYMSLMGPEGLKQVAAACFHNTHTLVDTLTHIPGVTPVFSAPYFHECLLQLNQPIEPVLAKLAEAGINGGYIPTEHYPHLKNTLLICATELCTPKAIIEFKEALLKIMSQGEIACL